MVTVNLRLFLQWSTGPNSLCLATPVLCFSPSTYPFARPISVRLPHCAADELEEMQPWATLDACLWTGLSMTHVANGNVDFSLDALEVQAAHGGSSSPGAIGPAGSSSTGAGGSTSPVGSSQGSASSDFVNQELSDWLSEISEYVKVGVTTPTQNIKGELMAFAGHGTADAGFNVSPGQAFFAAIGLFRAYDNSDPPMEVLRERVEHRMQQAGCPHAIASSAFAPGETKDALRHALSQSNVLDTSLCFLAGEPLRLEEGGAAIARLTLANDSMDMQLLRCVAPASAPPPGSVVWMGELSAQSVVPGAVTRVPPIAARLAFRESDAVPLELLIIVCSPHVAPLKHAGDEAVAVRTATSWGTACEHIFGTTLDELRQVLLRRRVARFLLVAHTDGSQPALTAPGGALDIIDGSLLAQMLGRNPDLKTVFINGCDSQALGRQCSDAGIECVVCWSTAVLDEAAAIFSKHFFQLVAQGESERVAFAHACHQVRTKKRNGVAKFELRAPDTPAVATSISRLPLAAGLPVMFLRAGGFLLEIREDGSVSSTLV